MQKSQICGVCNHKPSSLRGVFCTCFCHEKFDYELPIDWCTKCNEPLGDNKKSTRLRHDQLKHPSKEYEKIKDIVRGFFVPILVILILSALVFVVFLVVTDTNNVTDCEHLTRVVNQQLENNNIELEKVNELFTKCDVYVRLSTDETKSEP